MLITNKYSRESRLFGEIQVFDVFVSTMDSEQPFLKLPRNNKGQNAINLISEEFAYFPEDDYIFPLSAELILK